MTAVAIDEDTGFASNATGVVAFCERRCGRAFVAEGDIAAHVIFRVWGRWGTGGAKQTIV